MKHNVYGSQNNVNLNIVYGFWLVWERVGPSNASCFYWRVAVLAHIDISFKIMFTASALDKTFDYENIYIKYAGCAAESIFILKIQEGTIEKWMQSLLMPPSLTKLCLQLTVFYNDF